MVSAYRHAPTDEGRRLMMKPDTPTILPLIDEQRCTGCGECETRCPTQTVAVIGGVATVINPPACTFCEICESYCPEGAIGRPFTITFEYA